MMFNVSYKAAVNEPVDSIRAQNMLGWALESSNEMVTL